MNGKTKNILIAVLLVGIISMTIAYASLSQVLNINGTAQLQNRSASWNIHFTHIQSGTEIDPHGYASVPANSTISLTDSNTTATLPMVTLNSPGDYVDFYFDVINEGDITGYLNIINNINIPSPSYANNETLTSEQRTALEAAITGSITDANGNALTLNGSLAKNGRLNLRVRISFDSNATVLPSQNVTFSNITASLVYGQDTVSQGGNGGNGGNTPQTPSNPYETTFDGNYTYEGPESYPFSTSFSNDWTVYLRNDGTTSETCAVFGNGTAGTVCMPSSYYNSNYSSVGNYNSDFEDVITNTNDITTIAGLEATGLKGYSLAKAEEMLNKGASSCNVSSESVNCYMISGGVCVIGSDGHVDCYDDNSYGACLDAGGGDSCSY